MHSTPIDRFFRPADLNATRRNHRQLQAQKLLFIAANVAGVLLLAFGAAWLYRRAQSDPRFAVRKIETAGVRHSSTAEVNRVLKQYAGANLFRLDIALLRDELSQLPWVRDVAIQKQLPDVLRITVAERVPVALAVRAGRFHYVDAGGVTIAPLDVRVGDPDLPIIVDRTPDGVRASVRFLTSLASKEPALHSRVSEIAAVPHGGFAIFDRDLNATVSVSDGDVDKWKRLYQIVAAERFPQGVLEYADLRFRDRIVVRTRPEQAALDRASEVIQ